MGRKPELIRWTLRAAASEFEISASTLASYLKANSLLQGKDGKYSTRQICEAIFDDDQKYRLRLIKAQAEERELSNAETRGAIVPLDALAKAIRRPLAAMKMRILSETGVSNQMKDELLSDLQELWGVVFGRKPTREKARAALKSANEAEKETADPA